MADLNESKLGQVLNEALDVIHHLFKNRSDEELSETDKYRIKAANNMLAVFPRYAQSRATVAHVGLEILRAASENEEQYRTFVRQHVPYSGVLKTVPAELLTAERKDIISVEEKEKAIEERYLAEKMGWQEERAELLFKINQLEHK